ncbi:MAG: biopolymer transporter ExbD [Phycisphaerales bacterium]|nr:MAG: biopolymer transporter ExbD [Phycisphaerales bacterium]
MRIRTRQSRRRIDRITLNLASMIDVTFLLLIYFMVSTVLARPEDRLSPSLQTRRDSTTALISDFQPQRVEVSILDGAPAYRIVGRVFRSQADLREAIEPLPKDPGLFIDVHDRVPVGFAVAAIQAARDAGFEQVTYVPVK